MITPTTPSCAHSAATRTAIVIAAIAFSVSSASAALMVPTDQMDRYLGIATAKGATGDALDGSDADLGSDAIVLSESEPGTDQVGLNLDDVFRSGTQSVPWVQVDDTPLTNPDYLKGAGTIREGTSWTGDHALTSPTGKFNFNNVELYAQRGVDADGPNPFPSPGDNNLYFPDGVGDGINPAGGQNINNGVNPNVDMTALRNQIDAFEQYVTDLAPEHTFVPPDSGNKIENRSYYEINVDLYDTNNDGIAVIDIDTGDSDFQIGNSNIVIESEKGTFAIFRILGGANLDLSESSIMIGDGVLGNSDAMSPSAPVSELGAIFVVANEYNDGDGGTNSGEELDSGDQVYSFDNMVVNGVGFYDLVVFGDDTDDGNYDDGETGLSMQNVQGCTHIISPRIQYSNVRLEHCAFPEMNMVPAPAALPAGLAMIGLIAMRRRR